MGQYGGARYWRGKAYGSWGDLSGALSGAGIDPNAWIMKHPGAAKAFGVDINTLNSQSSASGSAGGGLITDSVIPGLGTYGMQQAAAEKAYEMALAQLGQGQQDVLQQFGFQADVNPNTLELSNVREDPTSVYGVLPMLRRQAAQGLQSAEDFEATRNIGRHGLAQRSEDELQYQAGAQQASAFADFRNAMQDIQSGRIQASGALQDANMEILMNAVNNAINQNMFNPADMTSLMDFYSQDSSSQTKVGKGAPGSNTIAFRGQKFQNKQQLLSYLSKIGWSPKKFRQKFPKKWKKLLGKV